MATGVLAVMVLLCCSRGATDVSAMPGTSGIVLDRSVVGAEAVTLPLAIDGYPRGALTIIAGRGTLGSMKPKPCATCGWRLTRQDGREFGFVVTP